MGGRGHKICAVCISTQWWTKGSSWAKMTAKLSSSPFPLKELLSTKTSRISWIQSTTPTSWSETRTCSRRFWTRGDRRSSLTTLVRKMRSTSSTFQPRTCRLGCSSPSQSDVRLQRSRGFLQRSIKRCFTSPCQTLAWTLIRTRNYNRKTTQSMKRLTWNRTHR